MTFKETIDALGEELGVKMEIENDTCAVSLSAPNRSSGSFAAASAERRRANADANVTVRPPRNCLLEMSIAII